MLILPLLVTTGNINIMLNIGNLDLNNGNEDRYTGTGTRIEKRISRGLDKLSLQKLWTKVHSR